VTSENPLVSQVIEGESYELRVLAAQGILPLSLAELIPLQVMLAASDDPYLAESAQASLGALERRVAATYLESDAPAEVMRYFALSSKDARLTEVVVRRRDVPRDLLTELAPKLSQDLQEILLLRQDAIVDCPAILDALAENPRLSPYARRRIVEYREHLLPRRPAELDADAMPEAPIPDEAELTQEDLQEIEQARALPAGGDVDRSTGLSEHQIRALALPLRLKLGRGASRTLRGILIKDGNPNIALAVLNNSAFTEDEIEQVASNRSVVDDVLVFISRRREWTSRYNVCLNLVRNPRTPAGIAVKLLARIGVRDLRNLSRDRNISDAVRTQARRLYRIKAV